MKLYKIIALFGKSGAGKSVIQNWITSALPNTNRIINCTTRPPRENEQLDIDYHFITEQDFTNKILSNEMIEAGSFNNWFYGTLLESLDINKINIGVFNVWGIECLFQDNRLDILPIYIKTSDKIRLIRSLNREKEPNCSEICRRFLEDEKDFSDISFNYIYYNNDINADNYYSLIEQPIVSNFIKGQK